MKTILYATDFSENSLNAFEFACGMSKKTESELIILHVHGLLENRSTISDKSTIGNVDEDLLERNKTKFQTKCQVQSEEDDQNPAMRFEELKNISASEGIVEMAENTRADLIIIGAKRKGVLRGLLMGDTAMKVVKKAPCPVLAVPAEVKFHGFKRIVFATGLEEKELEVINALSDIARLFESEIKIVHVSPEEDYEKSDKVMRFKELLREKISYANINFEFLNSKNIHERLLNYIKTKDVALIAMLEEENRNILERWLEGDLVRKMMIHTAVPLLSFNEKFVDEILEKKLKEIEKVE